MSVRADLIIKANKSTADEINTEGTNILPRNILLATWFGACSLHRLGCCCRTCADVSDDSVWNEADSFSLGF